MNLLLLFVVLSIVNVVLSTIKSIMTIKSDPWIAALISALYYGFYTIVVIYTVADFPLWQKVAVTAGCNLVGVFIVKYGEAKARKSKLWKVELTVPTKHKDTIDFDLREVPHSYIELSDKHTLFNFYCATQEESKKVKEIANHYEAKYFVAESKNL